MRKGENKVRFDLADGSGTFVQSCYAYASPVIVSELHRQHLYKVQFNDDPKYPQIIGVLEEIDKT